MHVHHLTSVDGEIVFDMDPDVVSPAAGGTRLAAGVTIDEVAALARAMTYKFSAFEIRMGGAKAGIRPRLLSSRAETIAAYVDEVRPLVEQRRFLTGPDIGTYHDDFVSLDDGRLFDQSVGGVPVEDLITGRGVVAAAEAWLGSLDGRTVAIEGFGTVGGGVARDVVRRGGRVVAVSTERGAVAEGRGFDLDELFEARAAHGDEFVHRLDREVHLPRELHELPVDVLVPGARVGVYTAELGDKVQAAVIAPAANVPYTAAGLDVLRGNRVVCLPDFVCNAGATLGYTAPRGLTPEEVLGRVDRMIGERIEGARLAKMDPIAYAAILADTFLATWIPADQLPDGPPLA